MSDHMPAPNDADHAAIVAEYDRQCAEAALHKSRNRHHPRFAEFHARATATGPVDVAEEGRRRMQPEDDELGFCRRPTPCDICPDPCDRFLRQWFQATGQIQMPFSGS